MTTEPKPTDTSEGITEKLTELTHLVASIEAPPPDAPAEPAPQVAMTESAPPKWPAVVDRLLLGLLMVLSFFLASFVASNSDLWMQLAIGRRLSDGQHQFGVDPFSWATEATETKPAVYWVYQGWLTSWAFFQLFQLAGGPALVVLKASLFVITMLLLSRIGWKDVANRWFLVICLTMAALAISPRLFLHSTVISFLLLALTLFVLDRAGLLASSPAEARPTCLWYLPPLFASWANLDAWFILGPMVLGLCWLASGLSWWFGKPAPVPGKRVALVFGVGVLACLLNPHFIRVFQLPPELAYLVLTLKIPLPDAIVAGGRTLNALRQAEPSFLWTQSPVSPLYWQNPALGFNIAAMAFYPLLLLGVLAFLLTAFVKPRPGAPTLHFGRFLIWLLFAVMALALQRLIPFFMIVAAPLTAMTLGEFFHWQQRQSESTAARHDRGLRTARLVSVPFMLVLLFFAWPGWLHGTNEYNSPRRVAWQVRPDLPMQQAAETLQALKQDHAGENVFNASFDQANYCAWFAPDVKCFMDPRFALFPDQLATFIRIQRALGDPGKPESDWQKLFKEHKVDQVVLANLPANANLSYWWVNADQWRLRGGDNRTMVFSWSGPASPWPVNTVRDDWNRRAFGEIPQAQRPPMHGAPPPQPLTTWDLYLHGSGPQPFGVLESQLLGVHYQTQNQLEKQFRPCSWLFALATLPHVQMVPGGGMTVGPSLACLWQSLTAGRPRDFGPPAIPILMVRAARRAVAENPQDPAGQSALMQANDNLRKNQEDYWNGVQSGLRQPQLLDRIRQMQNVAAHYNLTQLQPDRFEHHFVLAQLYMQSMFLDLALDHLQMAETALEIRKNTQKHLPRDFDDVAKKVHDEVHAFERKVQLRQAKFKEKSFGKSPLQLAEYAVAGPYQEEIGERAVAMPLFLGKRALEILQTIDPASLAPEDRSRYLQLHFELSLTMGRGAEVAEILLQPGIRQALPPRVFARYQVLAGGVQGNYAMMAEGLQELDKDLQARTSVTGGIWVTSMYLLPTMNSASVLGMAITLQSIPGLPPFHDPYSELFTCRTLHGIVLLEAGDTHGARLLLSSAVREAHPAFPFADQALARRYLELLNERR